MTARAPLPELEPPVSRPPAAAARYGPSHPASVLLELQRAAGNAAVGRVLARTPQQDTLKALQATKGYQALSAGERARLDALVGGGTSVATHAWPKMKELLEKQGTDKDAAKTFQDFVTGGTWQNFDVRLPGEKRLAAAPATTEAPVEAKAHPFDSGTADARKSVVKVERTWPDGTKETFSVPVFAPKSFTPPKPERVLPSEADIAKVLAEVPIQTLAAIKRVDLNPKANPNDATWQADPNYNPSGGEFVTHMAAGAEGVVSVYPSRSNADPKEIETTLVHETGHAVSRGAWAWDAAKWDAWKKARAADGFSVSQYAKSSDGEDFAESWILFVTAYGTPLEAEVRALIPNRCKLLDGFIKHKKP